MNRRLVVFFGFYGCLVVIVMIIYSVINPSEKEIAEQRLEYIEDVKWKAVALETLADSISRCKDTSFCADYSYKSAKFYFYRIGADTIGSLINNPSFCVQDAVEFSRYVPIDRIWNNKTDSLYRFDYPGGSFWHADAYVTKGKDDTTSYFKADSSILRITARVYLKLKRIR